MFIQFTNLTRKVRMAVGLVDPTVPGQAVMVIVHGIGVNGTAVPGASVSRPLPAVRQVKTELTLESAQDLLGVTVHYTKGTKGSPYPGQRKAIDDLAWEPSEKRALDAIHALAPVIGIRRAAAEPTGAVFWPTVSPHRVRSRPGAVAVRPGSPGSSAGRAPNIALDSAVIRAL